MERANEVNENIIKKTVIVILKSRILSFKCNRHIQSTTNENNPKMCLQVSDDQNWFVRKEKKWDLKMGRENKFFNMQQLL